VKSIVFIFGLITLIGIGCTKEPMPTPCIGRDCDKDTTKHVFHPADSFGVMPILWYQKGHGPDTTSCSELCFATDYGVIGVNSLAIGSYKAYVRLLDRDTGKELWYWDKMPEDHYTDIQFLPERGVIALKYRYFDIMLDIRTGQEIMNVVEPSELKYKTNNFAIIGDYYYTSVYNKSNNPYAVEDSATLIRTEIGNSNRWEKLYTLSERDIAGYTPYFMNLKFWQNPYTLDTIILINTPMFHWERYATNGWDGSLERSDIIAYNLTKRKVEWKIDSICKVSDNGSQFILDGNYMYFNTGLDLVKIDLLHPHNQLYTYYSFSGAAGIVDREHNRMIAQSLGISSVALDEKKVYWKFDDPAFGSSGFDLFDGYVYVSNNHGALYVFNAETGKIVFKERPPGMMWNTSDFGMQGKISVDRTHRLLYCSDNWGTYCLKLPDKWE